MINYNDCITQFWSSFCNRIFHMKFTFSNKDYLHGSSRLNWLFFWCLRSHSIDVTMSASQITSLAIVYWSVYSGTDQIKPQSSSPLAIVRGINRWPVNTPHKWPITRKVFPFGDVIMLYEVQGWKESYSRQLVVKFKIIYRDYTDCDFVRTSSI